MGRAVISAGSIQGFRYGLKAYSTDGAELHRAGFGCSPKQQFPLWVKS